MPYIASNNGLSWIWRDPSENHQIKEGEVALGDGPPTEEELAAAFPGYKAAREAEKHNG